jgi:hypothetical protein
LRPAGSQGRRHRSAGRGRAHVAQSRVCWRALRARHLPQEHGCYNETGRHFTRLCARHAAARIQSRRRAGTRPTQSPLHWDYCRLEPPGKLVCFCLARFGVPVASMGIASCGLSVTVNLLITYCSVILLDSSNNKHLSEIGGTLHDQRWLAEGGSTHQYRYRYRGLLVPVHPSSSTSALTLQVLYDLIHGPQVIVLVPGVSVVGALWGNREHSGGLSQGKKKNYNSVYY